MHYYPLLSQLRSFYSEEVQRRGYEKPAPTSLFLGPHLYSCYVEEMMRLEVEEPRYIQIRRNLGGEFYFRAARVYCSLTPGAYLV